MSPPGSSASGTGAWQPRGRSAGVPLRAATPLRLPVARRRRRIPHLLVGVLLVVVCALAFFVGSLRASGRVPVLVLARDVDAGQVLTSQDLRVALVAAEAQVGSVPATQATGLVGARMAVPRPAGALLARTDVGPARFPAPGKAVVAVALKAGQFPPDLTPGTSVAALVTSPPGATGTGGVAAGRTPGRVSRATTPTWVDAVVVSLAADTSGTTVVALLMDENAATAVGGAQPGTVALLQLSGPRGG